MAINKLLLRGRAASGTCSSPADGNAGAGEIRIGGRLPAAVATGTLAGMAGDARNLDGDGALWALSSPNTMARTARDQFGPEAVTAAARCAVSALVKGQDEDFRFWLAVFDLLDAPPAGWTRGH